MGALSHPHCERWALVLQLLTDCRIAFQHAHYLLELAHWLLYATTDIAVDKFADDTRREIGHLFQPLLITTVREWS